MIITQLSNISEQLNQIRENQEYAMDAIQQIHRNTEKLGEYMQGTNGRLDAIQENQRVQQYFAEQTQSDVHFLKDYTIMRDWMLA